MANFLQQINARVCTHLENSLEGVDLLFLYICSIFPCTFAVLFVSMHSWADKLKDKKVKERVFFLLYFFSFIDLFFGASVDLCNFSIRKLLSEEYIFADLCNFSPLDTFLLKQSSMSNNIWLIMVRENQKNICWYRDFTKKVDTKSTIFALHYQTT